MLDIIVTGTSIAMWQAGDRNIVPATLRFCIAAFLAVTADNCDRWTGLAGWDAALSGTGQRFIGQRFIGQRFIEPDRTRPSWT